VQKITVCDIVGISVCQALEDPMRANKQDAAKVARFLAQE